jgi:predicted component of type VI protein secretion system
MATKKEKTQMDYLKSIDLNLKDLNEFLQGEFFEKIESVDWKLWEMHNKSDRIDKMLSAVEDVKSLLRVHLMNDDSQSTLVEEISGKPDSVIGKLFKSKK